MLTQQFRMELPLVMVVRGLFTGRALGWYPPSSSALPALVLAGRHMHIVSTESAG